MNNTPQIMTPKETARLLQKSLKWVYRNAQALGGSKIGGSLFFTDEGVWDAIQRGQKVAGSGDGQPKTGCTEIIQIKERSRRVGTQLQEKSQERRTLAQRVGLAHLL